MKQQISVLKEREDRQLQYRKDQMLKNLEINQ